MSFVQLLPFFLFLTISQSSSQRWPLSGTCYPCSCDINQKGFGRVKYVNCSNLALTRIPRNLPLDLHTLDFSNNRILPQEIQQLCTFNSMQYVALSYNSLDSIPPEIFKDLENLHTLVLHGISSIPTTNIFEDLFNLEYLDINDCHVNQIPDNWFRKLYSLKTLKLRQTGIRSIEPGVLDGLLNLQELDLSHNVMRTAQTESFKPIVQSIRRINFRGNMFKTIGDHLFEKMYNLVELDLSDNKLESIHKRSFLDLRQLINLDIRDNKLSNLPGGLFKNLRNLQTLNLAMNTFNNFPETLFKIGYLLKLDLSYNRIRRLPDSFVHSFPYLEFLNVDKNPLHCDCKSLDVKFYQPNLVII
ncbi:hypothetical protein LOTGIDRAFT_137329, partial [Lottia gigantea]